MKRALFNVLALAGLTIWAAIAHPWVAPGLAVLTLRQAMLPTGVWLKARGSVSEAVLLAKLWLGYIGVGYLVALAVATPRAGAFWAIFGTVLALAAPVAFLARRMLLRPGRVEEPAARDT